jgi:hypothetical protein
MFRVYMDVWIFVAIFLSSFAVGYIFATTRRK